MPLRSDLDKYFSIWSYDYEDKWYYPSGIRQKIPVLEYHHENPYRKLDRFKRVIKFYYEDDDKSDYKMCQRLMLQDRGGEKSPYWRDSGQRKRSMGAAARKRNRDSHLRAVSSQKEGDTLKVDQKKPRKQTLVQASEPELPDQERLDDFLTTVYNVNVETTGDNQGAGSDRGKLGPWSTDDGSERLKLGTWPLGGSWSDGKKREGGNEEDTGDTRGEGGKRKYTGDAGDFLHGDLSDKDYQKGSKMGDSDSERGAGSDIDEDDDPGFDPTADMEQMTEKERKKWEKNLQKWRIFMDFLFRHVAIATFKYNCFEQEDLPQFMIALEKAEELRSQMKMKKGEVPRISCYKVMRESTELLKQHKFINEANRIRRFLDICGRMKGISMIAGGFYKALKKGKVKGLDKIKYYLDYWKGFCVRSFDYGELQFRNAEPDAFNELEQKFMVWNASLRTSLNLSQKFLKKCSESTGLDLMNEDHKVQIQHMQAAEYVVARKIEELLFQKVEAESKQFLTGAAALLGGGARAMTPAPGNKWEMPDLSHINPALLAPIPDSSIMLSLPPEPPKDKKKKKGKGKKGGRGKSASSSKSKKKKRK